MRLYHGTRKEFDAFDPYMIGMGAEPNSALGVWLTQDPHIAAGYGGETRLVIAEVDAPRLAVGVDYQTAIWGGPDLHPTDREISWPRFEKARRDLMEAGFDGVMFDCPGTDLEGAVCIFDASKIRITEVLEYPEEADLCPLENPPDDSVPDWSVRLEEALGVSPEDPDQDEDADLDPDM